MIAGSGRYILVQPGQAEIAFLVVDAYQGQGIGTILMRHLALLARDAGLKELVAEVLPENAAMLKLFKKFGFRRGLERIASGGPPDDATGLSGGSWRSSLGWNATAVPAGSGDSRCCGLPPGTQNFR